MTDLILVPTQFERRGLGALAHDARLHVVGFGPIAAAARTAQLVGTVRPRRVVLVGIAGSFDAERAPLGTARWFDRVELTGVGVASATGFLGPTELGFPQLPATEARAAVFDGLALARPLLEGGETHGAGTLLTAATASADTQEAALRRERHPRASAEDMEAFGVALGAHLFGVPCAVVRGLSNAVGDRNTVDWCTPAALAAAAELTLHVLDVEWRQQEDGRP